MLRRLRAAAPSTTRPARDSGEARGPCRTETAGHCDRAVAACGVLPQRRKFRPIPRRAETAGGGAGRLATRPRGGRPYLVYDQGIVNRDRGQRVFGQIFTEFAGRMAANFRMQNGQQHIKTYSAAFARAEKEYGVPPAVIAAFWGLESDFGANMGNLPTLRSLVSLAYDCRRTERFQNETIAALKVIERGDLTAWRDDRLLGRRARTDAIPADALFHLCGRLRRRRPPQSPAIAHPT